LLLWAESSVLGRDDRNPDQRLRWEAQRRNVAWLFGTEGGSLNLVRGEVDGRASFIQGKVEPMAFGERNPGPEFIRRYLDQTLGMRSQVPGALTPESSFLVPTPQGPVKIHPLICSEALLAHRVRRGWQRAGGDLLTNHTNDGWFDTSIATDLHAAQIRLRSVEMGIPLVRSTLTGKSGLFHEDGTWDLWGKPMSADVYAVPLHWKPVSTPARSLLLALFFTGAAILGLCKGLRMSIPPSQP
jgi:apolipoprotein N-acyltransferase